MEFPLQIGFRSLGGPLYVHDQGQRLLGVVNAILNSPYKFAVFADEAQSTPHYRIERTKTEGEIDYVFASSTEALGSMSRSGRRSIWQAHYLIRIGEKPTFEVIEENPLVKVLDFFAGFLPIPNRLTDLFFNPTYLITRMDGAPAMRLRKDRTLYDMMFTVERLGDLSAREQEVGILGLVMVIFRERDRG
jgi:hypothetical protein